jgi:16S rRNA (guanine966-N2)-methyltransferase
MRIIAGRLGGQNFQAPKNHRTHPMSDRARGALFNTLGPLEGLTILDAFAGTGAVGFEALSRGARRITAIEVDRVAQRSIADNASKLGLSARLHLIKANARAWLATSTMSFDIVLLDPPYDDPQPPLMQRLSQCVKPGGLLVLSWPGKTELPGFPAFELIETKKYGDIQLGFYRREPRND